MTQAIRGRKPFFRPHLVTDSTRAAGDDPAERFRALILPHMDSAYNFARYLARDATAAEDIVQEAFLRAFRAFPTYRGGAPKAWLFAIVRNCFLNWAGQRSGAARAVVDEGSLSETQALALANVADEAQDTPEAALLRRREIETVRAVIENLPEPFRETLVLREMEELSYKEISVLTAAPIGTVMSRLARARQMLGDMLMPHGATGDSAPALRETQR
jgi:RNA polymerase sigma factor (sigma-70 family)